MLNALSRPRCFWLLLTVFGLAHLILRLRFLGEPLGRDEGFYATVATVILDGGMPYRDAIDVKPPGAYLVYAAFIAVGGETPEAIRIGTALWSLATLLALSLVGRALHGPLAGLLAGGMFAVFGATPLMQADASNAEVFLGLPLLLWHFGMARYAEAPRRPAIALAGLGVALAIAVDTTALVFLVLSLILALVLAWRRHSIAGSWIRPIEWLLLFPLCLFVALGAWFSANGALDDFLRWSLRLPFGQAAGPPSGGSDLLRSLAWHHEPILPFVVPALAFGIFRLLRSGRRIDAENVLAWAFLTAIVAFLLAGGREPHRHLLLLPFGCALSAVALTRVLAAPAVVGVPLLALWTAAAALFVVRAAPWYADHDGGRAPFAMRSNNLFVCTRDVGRHIAEQTQPGETVFQWGVEPQIYFESNRRPASRYLATVLPRLDGHDRPTLDTLHRELATRLPRYIVVSEATVMNPGFGVVSAVMRDHAYRLEAVFPYSENGRTLRLAVFRLP